MGAFFILHDILSWVQIIQHELLLFAAFWFVVGAIDELGVDLLWLWMRATGRFLGEPTVEDRNDAALAGPLAVFVPAWHEADVIGAMLRHTRSAWRHEALAIYLGIYPNDAATLAAALGAVEQDARVRIVVCGAPGPTTKADCLNRLYAALCADEERRGVRFRGIVLHDAEDMVHPAALALIDDALARFDFVQLPVRPEPQPASTMVAGHYADEFAEAHAKAMVVRDVLGVPIPAAGVGCGFSRTAIERLAQQHRMAGEAGPFAAECLTEDYELGLIVSRGRRARFIRCRDRYGELVATRAFFPATMAEAIRQKTRWIHGISLQGWDRLGWSAHPIELWMALRDRRGPLTALVLAVAYVLLAIEAVLAIARLFGWPDAVALSPLLKTMLAISFASLIWRALWRFFFTAREYGLIEGVRGVLRIPVSNVIAIIAGRRAIMAYIRSLRGEGVAWDKTRHDDHPAISLSAKGRSDPLRAGLSRTAGAGPGRAAAAT